MSRKQYRVTSKGFFELKVMYLGLYNSLETFQRMMNSIIRELLHEEVHGQFCYTNQDKERIRRKDNIVFKDCRETQFLFQIVKV